MKGRAGRWIRDLLYELRTEGMAPGRQAAPVGMGAFIGCTPFFGFHFFLCVAFARLFRLNQGLTYLAAHVSLPGVWPLLVLAELEVGRRLRGKSYLGLRLAEMHPLDLIKQFWVDALLGSAVVGAVLAILLGGFTLWAARRRQMHPETAALLEETARPYMEAGMIHWEFVRGKLRHDPVYFNLLRRGFLPSQGLLLDLGCGRGIVFSLLLAARDLYRQGIYPEDWPPPPSHLVFHGIEGRPKTTEAARKALAGQAEIETADLRTAELPQADAILLLDVLHYLPAADQKALLSRVASSLKSGGLLLVRDADAGAGWRFTATRIQERLSALLRGHLRQRYQYRSAAEWTAILEGLGLTVELHPMAMGTPYANVLLAGRS